VRNTLSQKRQKRMRLLDHSLEFESHRDARVSVSSDCPACSHVKVGSTESVVFLGAPTRFPLLPVDDALKAVDAFARVGLPKIRELGSVPSPRV
jgi:hypothetical protein